MARTSLPPGFRFHPTDVELVKYYLKRKVMGKKLRFDAISELNIYKYSPWDLPDKSFLRSKDLEWYFFCPKERKYASGARVNRATESGYWKSTGKDRPVLYDEQTVGMVKTLVFHRGHAPKGERTNWVIHEYRIQDKALEDAGVILDAYLLCKVFQKSGLGPKNGAQYGAPFNEEEWDDDSDICAESLPSNSLPPPPLHSETGAAVTSTFVPGSTSTGPLSEPGPSNVLPSAAPPVLESDEDLISLLNWFTEDDSLLPDHTGNNEKMGNLSYESNNQGLAWFGGNEVFNGSEDLDNWADLNGGRFGFSGHQTTEGAFNPVVAGGDAAFLELNDLSYPLNCYAAYTGSEHFVRDRFGEPCFDSYLHRNDDFPVDYSGAVQPLSTVNQLPVTPEVPNMHGQWHLSDVFQDNDGLS